MRAVGERHLAHVLQRANEQPRSSSKMEVARLLEREVREQDPGLLLLLSRGEPPPSRVQRRELGELLGVIRALNASVLVPEGRDGVINAGPEM